MNESDLTKEIARLEHLNDQILTELGYVDHLMRLVGFSGGLETVKQTAKELCEMESEEEKLSTDTGTGF